MTDDLDVDNIGEVSCAVPYVIPALALACAALVIIGAAVLFVVNRLRVW